LAAILGSLLLNVLANDIAECAPRWCARLLRRAADRYAVNDRERWLEEWLAELDAAPGTCWKIKYALSIFFSIRAATPKPEMAEGSFVLKICKLVNIPPAAWPSFRDVCWVSFGGALVTAGIAGLRGRENVSVTFFVVAYVVTHVVALAFAAFRKHRRA
jgi:hypothetical protein